MARTKRNAPYWLEQLKNNKRWMAIYTAWKRGQSSNTIGACKTYNYDLGRIKSWWGWDIWGKKAKKFVKQTSQRHLRRHSKQILQQQLNKEEEE